MTDVERTEALAAAARRYGARVHLDGARLPNAAVALGVPLAELAAPVDTVALSLNKGLCAPFGALLAGDADDDRRGARPPAPARRRHDPQGRHRRRGRASSRSALVDRLADDHRRARDLAALDSASRSRRRTSS